MKTKTIEHELSELLTETILEKYKKTDPDFYQHFTIEFQSYVIFTILVDLSGIYPEAHETIKNRIEKFITNFKKDN